MDYITTGNSLVSPEFFAQVSDVAQISFCFYLFFPVIFSQKGIPSKHRGSPPDWPRTPRPKHNTVCSETGDLLTYGQSPIYGTCKLLT